MSKTWIPVDVKVHWFSFLEAEDLARASRVCRPWASLVQKTAEAVISTTICAPCPALTRVGKLQLLRRLQHAGRKENMGYLLSWAAGNRGACVWGGGCRRVRARSARHTLAAGPRPPPTA